TTAETPLAGTPPRPPTCRVVMLAAERAPRSRAGVSGTNAPGSVGSGGAAEVGDGASAALSAATMSEMASDARSTRKRVIERSPPVVNRPAKSGLRSTSDLQDIHLGRVLSLLN